MFETTIQTKDLESSLVRKTHFDPVISWPTDRVDPWNSGWFNDGIFILADYNPPPKKWVVYYNPLCFRGVIPICGFVSFL